MDGLTNIIAKIHEQTDAECENILKNAQEKASAILEEARKNACDAASKIESLSRAEADTMNLRAVSSADAEYKRVILAKKSELLDKAVAVAVEKIKNSPVDEYFGYIGKLILSNALDGKGIVKMSKIDADRMPSDFVAKINGGLSDGRSIEVSADDCSVDSGFIIEYPDIRIDCTFSSLVEDKIDEIRDELSKVLFS